MATLERLIYKYLCDSYPNSYRKVTKFGLVLENDNDLIHGHRIVETIVDLFGCEYSYAFRILDNFMLSRPIINSLKNSTNLSVSVFHNENTSSSTFI